MEPQRFNFPDTVPLVQLENGAVRVRKSRVTMETIVHRMQMGETAEEIHEGFPTVSVSQIEDILNWYFDNKSDADEYLQEVEAEAVRLREWAKVNLATKSTGRSFFAAARRFVSAKHS